MKDRMPRLSVDPLHAFGKITAVSFRKNRWRIPIAAAFADGLTRAGHPSLRFNFPYKEKGLKTPDRPEILEDAWATVCRHFLGQTGIGVTHVVAADR